ncbi:hypothetical protein [Cellulomonas sp. URHB0016]
MTSEQATVETRYDDPLRATLEVRTEEGLPAARAAARLVRQAVLTAAARGTRTVWATLDVSGPVCGAALEAFRDLAGHGIGDLQVRRVGGSILVDLQLTVPVDTGVAPAAGRGEAPPASGPVAASRPAHRDRAPHRRHVRSRTARADLESARRAQGHLRTELMGRAGVTGVGVARRGSGYVLRVNVVDPTVDVPADTDGVPVDVRVTGALAPLGE